MGIFPEIRMEIHPVIWVLCLGELEAERLQHFLGFFKIPSLDDIASSLEGLFPLFSVGDFPSPSVFPSDFRFL